MTVMELTQANGEGWVLFGFTSQNKSDWFERWFSTDKKAVAYAVKRGWKVQAAE